MQGEKLTKKEKQEQKREEKKELKRERSGGAETSNTAPTVATTNPESSATPDHNAQRFQSQAPKFNPRKVEPMGSPSPSPTVALTSSPNTPSTAPSSSGEKLTKQEKKELKREEKKELKRERREAGQRGEAASPSPSATP
jgi:hypothetical protein